MPPSHILTLREYETATIGLRWDPARKIVPTDFVAQLAQLQAEHRAEYVLISHRRIKANNYVGVVSVGQRLLEILPKTDAADDTTRRRVVEMLAIAGMLPHLEAGLADMAVKTSCLLDAFMQAYIRQLALEWRRGRISNYQKLDENRTSLRGKLLFKEHMRLNRLRPERFFTRADQFVVDVSASRLLRAGLEVCRRHGLADATRRGAISLLAEFDDVSAYTFSEVELDSIQTDRRIARFDPLLTLAKQFVRGQVPDRPGVASTYSLLFDMNVIFERYVGRLLRRVCPPGFRSQLQVSSRSLVTRGGKPKFRLRPDAAIRFGPYIQLLIDTKWKLLDLSKTHEGVRQSDMYQAYAYSREYDCPNVILLYPRWGELRAKVADYCLSSGNDHKSIQIATVDISKPTGEVCRELGELLRATVSDKKAEPTS